MDCPKCGYVMDAFELDCPRCKRMQADKPNKLPSGYAPTSAHRALTAPDSWQTMHGGNAQQAETSSVRQSAAPRGDSFFGLHRGLLHRFLPMLWVNAVILLLFIQILTLGLFLINRHAAMRYDYQQMRYILYISIAFVIFAIETIRTIKAYCWLRRASYVIHHSSPGPAMLTIRIERSRPTYVEYVRLFASLRLYFDLQGSPNFFVEMPVFVGIRFAITFRHPPTCNDANAVAFYPQRDGDPIVFAIDEQYWCSRDSIKNIPGIVFADNNRS